MNLNKIFTADNKKRISAAVKQLEKNTSGELVPVVANRSGKYRFYDTVFSLIISYIAGIILYEFEPYISYYYIFSANILSFIIVFCLLKISFIRTLLIPEFILQKKVEKSAVKAFFENKLYNTRDKTGILIYVSILEKQVVVLGDEGINSKVKPEDWQNVVNIIINSIKKKDITDGIVSAIGSCREMLQKNFPIKPDDTNELSNDLVIKVI